MKTIEQILQELYAANSYLTVLVPSAKFITGTAKGIVPPYATLNREGSNPLTRSNVQRIDRTIVRVQAWASHSVGSALRDTLIDAWDNLSIETSNPRVLSIRKANDLAIEEDDGIWQFLIDFEITTQAR